MSKIKIDALTKEQEALLTTYRDKWIGIGMSTAPLDLEKAKAAVCMAYRLVGLKEPTRFDVADSPIHAIKVVQKYDPNLTPSKIFSEMSYGNHDASWLGFYEYFRDVCKLEVCNQIDGLINLANHCGWLNMYEDLVVFQHRPVEINMDDQKRIHSDHGPAIQYRDGFAIYAWHGVRIPSEWIEDKASLTAQIALMWENIEQRRAACEILGWKNILDALKAKKIDEDDDPMIGTLVEVNIPDIGEERFLKVLCGTGREFAIPVPKNMKTAIQANAWTFGIDDVNSFEIPEVRT